MFSGVVTGDIRSLLESTNRLSHVSTRQQSEDSIHRQLAAFERLLQHTMSRFSNDNVYAMLLHLTRWAEANQRPKHKHATKVSFKLKSVKQLQEIMALMKQRSTEDENILKNCELFLNDLLYLKDLKKYFNDEIYSALMKYHFDTDADSPREVSARSMSVEGFGMKHLGTIKAEDEDSGNGSQIETDDNRVFRKVNNLRKKKTKTSEQKSTVEDEVKYKKTVSDLQSILQKWDGLLSDDVLELNCFDPDSYHELMKFSNYSQFESLLRLVPDIFAKCYKSIELAKDWLRLSNIVLEEEKIAVDNILPKEDAQKTQTNREFDQKQSEDKETSKEFMMQVQDIQSQIKDVNKAIIADEELLNKYNREMDILVGRDERVPTMSSRVETIDSLITLAAGEYQKTKTEQYSLANKIKSCKKGTSTYTDLKSHLKRLDTEVAQKHWKVKRLEYERNMVGEDLMVEAEIRPSLIRFIGDTKEKMEDLEKFLQVKRDEKTKLEKQLALMKTNTERMRQIMRSYLGSASTVADVTSRESSTLSTPSDFELVLGRLDGNEADDDSSSPYSGSPQNPHVGGLVVQSSAVKPKPKLVKKDLRPSSERLSDTSPIPLSNNSRVSRVGSKAALKTTPRRVWENV